MSLFHKKDKIPEIPEVPQVPNLPPLNLEKKDQAPVIPSLPSFSGDGRDEVNRDAIKSAVEDSSEKIKGDTSGALTGSMKGFEESGIQTSIPSLPPMKQDNKPEELSFTKPEVVPLPPKIIEKPRIESAPMPEQNNIVKKDAEESIFVRIDKFNSAKRDVQEISRDLKEIEQVLTKLEQIKMQEDEEVAEIAKVMEEIKLKMNRIDSDIFNRI